MGYHDDPAGYEARLRAKLTPERMRATLAFAGLYQMTNEMIRHAVVDEVREFYANGIANGQITYNEPAYARDVLARGRNRFAASLAWLVNMGALTGEQADRLTAIYAHRNELTHELVRYIVDPDAEPDADLFIDALTILKAIRRFWTSVEADLGTFADHPDVELDDIVPLSLAVLQQCIDAYAAGIEDVQSSCR